MREPRALVVDTGPILALVAATGDLDVLRHLYQRVIVPREVACELTAPGAPDFAQAQLLAASWLETTPAPTEVPRFLANSLDLGEAAVIALALSMGLPTVCIDEAVGRHVARISGLAVTGSIGILLRARREGFPVVVRDAIDRMRAHGVWVSDGVIAAALRIDEE